MSRVLIVDDEPTICWTLTEALQDEGHVCRQAASAEAGLAVADEFAPDVVLLDVRLPGRSGLDVLGDLERVSKGAPVVVMTAFGDLPTAVKAVSGGAFEYLVKPFELDDALRLVERAARQRQVEGTIAPSTATMPIPGEMLGRSAVMQQVFKRIALAAASDAPVLITGESGTGKELVAQAIHRHSRRAERPFLPVVLAALNENLVESELFGHVRGAFTGAERERPGVLELAQGGSVMLDEIGDVPLAVQVKLLRAIERQEWLPVGDARPKRGDFRVIAATHRPLERMIREGTFREDLYYRLNVFPIELPPLRDRLEDLPELAQAFLAQCTRTGEHKRFTDEALAELARRDWPGNVRQLRNVVEHASIVSRSQEIGRESLPPPSRQQADSEAGLTTDPRTQLVEATRRFVRDLLAEPTPTAEGDEPSGLHDRLLETVEPALFDETLRHCGGNRLAASQRLGIHRATLRQKMRRYGMDDPE
ncbi:MAG TPA: sigma-54 dependent transcriptional regulator [Pirellulaceae bacterium]|nr:sigma-54 dependent transcriptional regulator [Pirellulaceae bacterium]